MSTKTITSSQPFQTPDGAVVNAGLLIFDLSQPAVVTSGGGLIAPSRVVVTLTSGGLIPANQAIYGNDQLTPSGTTYRVRLYDSGGSLLIADFGNQSISGASPIDLSTMTPTSSSGGTVSYPNPVLVSPAGDQHILTTNNLTTPKLNGVTVFDGTQFTSLQTALTAAAGGELYIPAGTYTLTSGLAIPSNTRVRGAGPQKTKLAVSGTAGFDVLSNSDTTNGNSNIEIMDLSIDTTSFTTGTPTAGRPIFLQKVTGFKINNCWLTNCYVHGIRIENGCSKGWILNNHIDTVRIGTGIECGNTPTASQVTDLIISNNYIANAAADGIFVLGSTTGSAYGTARITIANNILNGNADTSIEVGVSSQDCTVTGNTIVLPASATVGIGIRGTRGVACSGNTVFGTNTASQVGILVWMQAGDNTGSVNTMVAGNTVYNCPNGIKTTGTAANIDSIGIVGNYTFSCTTPYSYSGNETNLVTGANDNRLFNGNVGITSATSIFTPTNLLHIKSTSGGSDLLIEQGGSTNGGLEIKNAVPQRWALNLRNDLSNAICFRDITNGVDAFQIAPSTANVSMVGTFAKVKNRSTASFGVATTFGSDDKTAQSASIGAVTLLTGTASTSGHYRVNGIIVCTTSDASGASVTATINWTQDGISRSATSPAVAFAATTNQQTFNSPMFVDASTNVTYSTTVTGVPTTGRYSVHIWLTQE